MTKRNTVPPLERSSVQTFMGTEHYCVEDADGVMTCGGCGMSWPCRLVHALRDEDEPGYGSND